MRLAGRRRPASSTPSSSANPNQGRGVGQAASIESVRCVDVEAAVDPKTLLGTNLFSLSQAEQHPDWLKEARIGEHTAETEEYGISSIVFRSRKPLDAGRLSMFFHASVTASDLDAIHRRGLTGRVPRRLPRLCRASFQ